LPPHTLLAGSRALRVAAFAQSKAVALLVLLVWVFSDLGDVVYFLGGCDPAMRETVNADRMTTQEP